MNLAKVSLLSITIALETLIVEVKDKRQKSIFEGVQHFEEKKKLFIQFPTIPSLISDVHSLIWTLDCPDCCQSHCDSFMILMTQDKRPAQRMVTRLYRDYGEALRERDTFFRLEVYKRLGIS